MNYMDNNIRRPYRLQSYSYKPVKILPKIPNTSLGKIEMELSGEYGNRQAFLTIGYKGSPEHDLYLLMDKEELKKTRDLIDQMISDIEEDKKYSQSSRMILEEFHRYLGRGYVKEVILTKLKTELPGFNTALYTIFHVEMKFKEDVPNDYINLKYNFIYCVHLSANEKDYIDTMNKLFGGHFKDKDLKITMIGYNRQEDIAKYIRDAKKDLANFDPKRDHALTEEQRNFIKNYYESMGLK